MRKGLGDAVSERERGLCSGLAWVSGPWAVAGEAPVWGLAETLRGQGSVVCVGGGSQWKIRGFQFPRLHNPHTPQRGHGEATEKRYSSLLESYDFKEDSSFDLNGEAI